MAASAVLLTGCDYNDKNFPELEDMVKPSDIKNIEYKMTDADYASVTTLTANKNLAKEEGAEKELAAVKTSLSFNEVISAQKYAPALLASKWTTADNGSVVKLTYTNEIGTPAYLAPIEAATLYTLTGADYESIWGEGSSNNFFTPSTPASTSIPSILATVYPEAANGAMAAITYNVSDSEPSGVVVAINEDFTDVASTGNAVVEGWTNVPTVGTYAWQGKSFGGNMYIQQSAYKHDGELESYMVSPRFTVSKDLIFSFESCLGNYKAEGGTVDVLISSNLAAANTSSVTPDEIKAATWENVTENFEFEIPTGTYGTLKLAGEMNLNKYEGKKINIAFRYNGDGSNSATTTVQIDNVIVKSEAQDGESEVSFDEISALYAFNGTAWSTYSNAYMMTKADFAEMGIKYDNFSSSINPDNYLPTFLRLKYAYAQEGDVKAVAYKYYSNNATVINADEYVYTASAWTKTGSTTEVTDQFVKTNNKWFYNPSVVINMNPGKNQPTSFYLQSICDWVWETVDVAELGITAKGQGYVTSYGNNDYYTGASAYQNNFDVRAAKAREQYAAGYEGMSDDEIVEVMMDRIPEALRVSLETNHTDVAPIDGVETFYTINFGIYTGSTINAPTHTIKFVVSGNGAFEYVEDSFKAL